MEKLIDKAKRFLDENLSYNEIELSDARGNKVKLVRITPAPYAVTTYPYQYTVTNPYGPSPY